MATNQYVVWLDIGMHDVHLPHEVEAEEHLVSIGSDSA